MIGTALGQGAEAYSGVIAGFRTWKLMRRLEIFEVQCFRREILGPFRFRLQASQRTWDFGGPRSAYDPKTAVARG